MTDPTLHIYAPPVTDQSYRVLGYGCRKFHGGPFFDFETALNHGLKTFPRGFRVFLQRCYEWHEPLNIQVAKIGKREDVTWRPARQEVPLGHWLEINKGYDIPEQPDKWIWQYFEDGQWSSDHEWEAIAASESFTNRYHYIERYPHRCRRKDTK